ncbi:hypothetical protein ACFCXT_30505 [Streptomyces vinaceus]|uniref:hypothetical protein n=1 Tax=Streptomyces vinaceus TaxID=1960 RepID=UPI0035D7B2CC
MREQLHSIESPSAVHCAATPMHAREIAVHGAQAMNRRKRGPLGTGFYTHTSLVGAAADISGRSALLTFTVKACTGTLLERPSPDDVEAAGGHGHFLAVADPFGFQVVFAKTTPLSLSKITDGGMVLSPQAWLVRQANSSRTD